MLLHYLAFNFVIFNLPRAETRLNSLATKKQFEFTLKT